jgi:DNA-binding NarL/FixJ family response regulator
MDRWGFDLARQGSPVHALVITPAQVAILEELCRDGADNQRIANRLGVTMNTVKCQLHRVMQEAGMPDRTALAVALLRGALVPQVRDRRESRAS